MLALKACMAHPVCDNCLQRAAFSPDMCDRANTWHLGCAHEVPQLGTCLNKAE